MEKSELIRCPRCESYKLPGAFYRSASTTNSRGCYCKPCCTRYKSTRKEVDNEVRRTRRDKQRVLLSTFVNDYKEQRGCKKCGESRSYVLDFHHREPSKTNSAISTMMYDASLKRMKAEIAKCDVLCSNCHRALHWLLRHPE